jgi:hypothetical protein
VPTRTIPISRPEIDSRDNRQPIRVEPIAIAGVDLIAPVLNSAAGTIQAVGLWRGHNAGVSVVAAISQSARSICPARYARSVERAAEIALMQHLGIDPDEMSLRAIAAWEDRSSLATVVAALRDATGQMSKLFGATA